jgi:hypothetical protein
MSIIVKGLILLSMLAFVLAVIGAIFGIPIIGERPEGFSRACNNLALIAIALIIGFKIDLKQS